MGGTLFHITRSLPVLPLRSTAANMTEVERWLRLLGGVVGAPFMYVVAVRPIDGLLAIVALIVLVAGAIDLVVSGVRGYCPVYRYVSVPWARTERLEHAPCPSRNGDAGGPEAGDDGSAVACTPGRR